MVAVCLCFRVHQPIYLRRDYTFFNIGQDHVYEDGEINTPRLNDAVDDCYLPANNLMLSLIREFGKDFKLAYVISGTTLEQLQRQRRAALDSFKRLAETGCVEFVTGPYHHSLASLFSRSEFHEQTAKHRSLIESLFKQKPETFCNTELIYNNDLAGIVEDMGYTSILTEGVDFVFGWRTPNFVYKPITCGRLKVMARNYRLSEEISSGMPTGDGGRRRLDAGQFSQGAHAIAGRGELLDLFMDYDVLSKAREKETGAFEFFRTLPRALLQHKEFCFKKPAEVAALYKPVARLDVPNCISWREPARDISAWIGSSLQDAALEYVFKLEKKVMQTGDKRLIDQWRRLQASDYFCSMSTKLPRNCGGMELNPYDSPHLAHIAYMNMLNDLHEQIKRHPNLAKQRRRGK